MPDQRQHRGAHPADAELFGAAAWPALRAAVADLSWLLSRGYADVSALKLVGDRFQLAQRQRVAVMRCACADEALARRRTTEVPLAELADKTVHLDGFNVLTSVEAALAGGVILGGRDGAYRDMASMHGSYRRVEETRPAVELIGAVLAEAEPATCGWYLDRPVSNSGRLATILGELAAEHGWPWRVELLDNVDGFLSRSTAVVASADSVILDRCPRWCNLAREVIMRRVPGAAVLLMAAPTASCGW